MKYCKHIAYSDVLDKYLVCDPAVLQLANIKDTFQCSVCNKSIPIRQRPNGRVRLLLMPKKEFNEAMLKL